MDEMIDAEVVTQEPATTKQINIEHVTQEPGMHEITNEEAMT